MKKYAVREDHVEVGLPHPLRIVSVLDAYALLDRMIEQQERLGRRVERFPYWAEIWPAALALARWMCTSNQGPTATNVLELGCGVGVVGIAMARSGWRVEATDFVEDALVFSAGNARLNKVAHRHQVGYLDWRNPVGEKAPCIVGSDILYERRNHGLLAGLLCALLEPGGWFYTSDPGRPMARDFCRMLMEQGYSHRQTRVEVSWGRLAHGVDIHAFQRPLEQ